MDRAAALEQLIALCTERLASEVRQRAALARRGITDSLLFESFRLGYCDDQVAERLQQHEEVWNELERCGAIKSGEVFWTSA